MKIIKIHIYVTIEKNKGQKSPSKKAPLFAQSWYRHFASLSYSHSYMNIGLEAYVVGGTWLSLKYVKMDVF